MTVADEVEVEQEHIVKPSGVDTHTDLYVPDDVDSVPERVSELLWEQFSIDVADHGLEVVKR